MELLSVNIGPAAPIGASGIGKTAVGAAKVGPLGLVGDAIVDVKHHSGQD